MDRPRALAVFLPGSNVRTDNAKGAAGIGKQVDRARGLQLASGLDPLPRRKGKQRGGDVAEAGLTAVSRLSNQPRTRGIDALPPTSTPPSHSVLPHTSTPPSHSVLPHTSTPPTHSVLPHTSTPPSHSCTCRCKRRLRMGRRITADSSDAPTAATADTHVLFCSSQCI